MPVYPVQHVPIVKSKRPENSGFYNDFRPPSLYSALYPSPNSLGMFKPYGLYKPLDRLMRYEGTTNGTPRYHPSLSIFKTVGSPPIRIIAIDGRAVADGGNDGLGRRPDGANNSRSAYAETRSPVSRHRLHGSRLFASSSSSALIAQYCSAGFFAPSSDFSRQSHSLYPRGHCPLSIPAPMEGFKDQVMNLLNGSEALSGEKIMSVISDLQPVLPSLKHLKVIGERGSGFRPRAGDVQDFEVLRDQCLQRGALFEDPDFDTVDSSLFYSKSPDKRFEWRRPSEIASNPQLFIEGASRFDVQQGELGDCWLLAAVANLTLNEKLFYQVVPNDQGFDNKYAGIFHFRFWQYGRWVDVVVDDRLPTYHGKLIFLHSATENEFWSALLEKAYAKIHGSYEALKGGSTCEAMEDFTGGVSEMYELNEVPPNLFMIMLKAFQRQSLMGCSIEADPSVTEMETPQGLVKGHAYSITRVTYVDITTPNTTGKIPLLRLRNPWGNEAEWNGPWSDKSAEWRFISESDKQSLGLVFDADGEFWMSYKDFVKYFSRLEICNLNPDLLTKEQLGENKNLKWEMSVFEGEWVRGATAGGCRNFLETFASNPQYRITLEDPDDEDEERKCTVIIALMQKNRRAQRKIGAECLTIGFAVYQLINPDSLPKPLDTNFFKYNASTARSPTFINLREISSRFSLPPGTYCIVPSTFDPNEQGEFLLRVFSEHENNMAELDDEVGMGEVDVKIKEQEPEPDKVDKANEKIKEFFLKLAGVDQEVDWMELKDILDYAMRNDVASNTNAGDNILINLLQTFCESFCQGSPLASTFKMEKAGFSKDVCRSMIAMMDWDRSGKLGFEEFKSLWIDIRQWKTVFKMYDKESKGYINGFELRQALNSVGYHLNTHILNIMCHRYATKDGNIMFDDFIMCAVRLKTMIDMFKERDPDNKNIASFTMEEWVEKTLYS